MVFAGPRPLTDLRSPRSTNQRKFPYMDSPIPTRLVDRTAFSSKILAGFDPRPFQRLRGRPVSRPAGTQRPEMGPFQRGSADTYPSPLLRHQNLSGPAVSLSGGQQQRRDPAQHAAKQPPAQARPPASNKQWQIVAGNRKNVRGPVLTVVSWVRPAKAQRTGPTTVCHVAAIWTRLCGELAQSRLPSWTIMRPSLENAAGPSHPFGFLASVSRYVAAASSA
jgi:hypothetical protein